MDHAGQLRRIWSSALATYAPLIAAALAAAFTVVAVLRWWRELGIADQWMQRGAWILFVQSLSS